jgi:ankyrin repeat protein
MMVRLHCTLGLLHKGHLDVVQALLGAEADVNKADRDGETPLYWASRDGALGGGAGSAGQPRQM